MSIADKITQLTTIRGDIRTALAGKGVSASDHNYSDFASDIDSISTGGLPSGYTAVEYIESSGTQYIDTGVIATLGTNIECEIYAYSNSPQWYCAFGSYSSSKSLQLVLQNGSNRFVFYSGASYMKEFNSNYGKKIKIITSYNGCQWEDLENTYSAAYLNYSHACDYSLGIFAGHESGGFNAGTLMRCYYFKIFEYGTLIRDFVPCTRDSDSEAGLYDLVNGVFYTNQGTGDFIVPSA